VRQEKTRQDKTRQDNPRQDKTRQDNPIQSKTRQDLNPYPYYPYYPYPYPYPYPRSRQDPRNHGDAITHHRVLQVGPGPDALGVVGMAAAPLLKSSASASSSPQTTHHHHHHHHPERRPVVHIAAPTEDEAVMHSVFGAIVAVGSTSIAYSLYSYCLLRGVDKPRNTAWSEPLNPWLILSIDFVLNDIGYNQRTARFNDNPHPHLHPNPN
jgi:hypothetical protein